MSTFPTDHGPLGIRVSKGPEMPTYLTMQQVCTLLQISRATAQRMVLDGRLPKPTKLGKSMSSPVRFDPIKIREFVDRQTPAA
jgi:excisionase family DNA binding protein